MNELTPEEILDDFARELKSFSAPAHATYVELRDKVIAKLSKARPDREKIKRILSKAEYVEENEFGAKFISAALSIQQVNKIANQILALFEEEKE